MTDPIKQALDDQRDMALLRGRVELLESALLGLRGMAEVEAAAGSKAWRLTIAEIDEVLKP